MSGFRNSMQLRELHDRAECPDTCPLCARIEQHDPPTRHGPRDHLTVTDYPEPR